MRDRGWLGDLGEPTGGIYAFPYLIKSINIVYGLPFPWRIVPIAIIAFLFSIMRVEESQVRQ